MPNNQQAAARESQAGVPASGRGEQTVKAAELPPDVAVRFQRVEKHLSQIRGALDAAARESEHREFSIGRLIGAILQVIVAGLVALALLDWLLAAPSDSLDSLFIKLAFAAVLQLSALTAFVLSRGDT